MDVRAVSVLAPDRSPDRMSREEQEEAGGTFYIRPRGFLVFLGAVARGFFSRPLRFMAGLAFSIRSSRWNLRTLIRHFRYFSEALITGFWMQELEIQHLHTHFASTVALFAQKVFPIQISATIHGPGEFDDPDGFLLREKVRAAEFVVAISQYGKSQLMRFSDPRDWPKLAVVRLGVNSCEFAPAPRAKTGSEPFEVICVGRLAPVKAQSILIQACASLVNKGVSLILRLVGQGPDREILEETAARLQVSDFVVFHGALSNDRVLELYRSADCFALASFAEGIPVVLMEAMALEIPCVATAITGIPELIENEVDGLLIPPSDEHAMASAIERLIADPELRNRLARAGRKKILREYELTSNIQALAGVFGAV